MRRLVFEHRAAQLCCVKADADDPREAVAVKRLADGLEDWIGRHRSRFVSPGC
jgi:hypothetical protein